jgi:2,3-bisphosphoglycerate-independent phosphoglycerate mutase
MKPIIFVVLDGAADSGARTPLSSARKPFMDSLAAKSFCGLWQGAKAPRRYNPKSMSDVATLELLGYSYQDNPGRGYLEALGIGLRLSDDSVCLRGNFATVKVSGKTFSIIDRRAGREETGLESLSKKLSMKINGISVKCVHSVGHRCVIVLEGSGLGLNITDSDSAKGFREIKGNDKPSMKTATVLNEFSRRAFEILDKEPINRKRKNPANFILMRGASRKKMIKSFGKKYGFHACSISGVGIIRGISKYLKIDVVEARGATGHLNTNLTSKLKTALKAAKKYDFVMLHINGCDEAGHDRNFNAKKRFIEKIDRLIIAKLVKNGFNMAITSDHQTSVFSGTHEFGSVPFLIHASEKNISNSIKNFSEASCKKGFFSKNLIKTTKARLNIKK